LSLPEVMSIKGPKPYVVLAISTLMLSGCGGSKDTARADRAPVLGGAEEQSAASASATVRSGGLTIKLTATPGRAKTSATIKFQVTASAQSAAGALGYQLRYGDGTSAENVVPQFCVAGRGTPVLEAWHLSHRYKAAGLYRVSASVYVNCTSDHATATVVISIA